MPSVVGWDTETGLITDTCHAPPLVCVTWAQGDAQGISHVDEALPLLENLLTDEDLSVLVAHNSSFDCGAIVAEFPHLIPAVFEAYDQGRIRCTMIRQKLIDIAFGQFRGRYRDDGTWEKYNYALADLSKRLLGIYLNKGEDTWRTRYIELRPMPIAQWPADAVTYAVLDARMHLRVHNAQEKLRAELLASHKLDIFADEPAQTRAAWWLHLAGCWGIRIHPERIQALAAGIQGEYDELEEDLIAEGLIRVERYKDGREKKRTRDTKAAKARMIRAFPEITERKKFIRELNGGEPVVLGYTVDEWGQTVPVYETYETAVTTPNPRLKKTPSGDISLDDEACEDSGDPMLIKYAQLTKLKSVLSKDVPAMMACYEIHGRFDSLQATSRSSCRGYNLQNPSRKGGVRECFIPREGYDFAIIDLELAELRGVAQVCLELGFDSHMARALNAGKDVHAMLGAQILGIPYEEMMPRLKAKEPEAKEARQIAKNCNFGFAGGMGVARFVDYVKANTGRVLEPERAKFLRDAWLSTWPEFVRYFRYHSDVVENRAGSIVFPWGFIRGGMNFSEACNTQFQTRIAAATKAAGFELARAMYDETRESILYGSRIANFVHDEWITEVPSETGHDCAQEIKRIVLVEVGKFMPQVLPKAIPYLARFWSKEAEPVFDADGRLIPWEGAKEKAA